MSSVESPLTSNFDKLVQITLSNWHVPGLSIGVVISDAVYEKGYGLAKLPNEPMRPDTLLWTASTTKAFTAAAASIVIDKSRGELNPLLWNSKLASRIGDEFVLPLESATLSTTVEDALSHRTGMPRHDFSIGSNDWTHNDDVRNLRNLPLTAEPRTTYQYCNLMYHAVARLIERESGNTLSEYLTHAIWRPLSMMHTFMHRREAEAAVKNGHASSIATGYAWDKLNQEFVPYLAKDWAELSGAGAIISNVTDYTRWLRCLLMESNPLSAAGHAALKTPRIHSRTAPFVPFTGSQSYALGLRVDIYRGYELYWHGGDVTGYGSHLCFIPAKKWGVVMMANAQANANYAEQILAFQLIDDLLGTPQSERFDWQKHFEGIVKDYYSNLQGARARLYPDTAQPILKAALPWRDYAGTYFHKGYRTITLEHSEEKFVGASTPNVLLRAECLDRMWVGVLELEHVSGEYFIAYMRQPKDKPDRDLFVFEDFAMRALFRIGVNGKVSELGLGLEVQMSHELLWFKKVDIFASLEDLQNHDNTENAIP